jgi:predicted transcriptional regulator
MIDFACKQFDLKEIIKCALGLTKYELHIFEHFLLNNQECTTLSISKKLNFNLTTIQKAVKKLYEKGILKRHQKNIPSGGYIYTYECTSKAEVRQIIKEVIKNWAINVEKNIDQW